MTAIDAHEPLDETQATEFGRVFDGSATAVVIVDKYAFGGALMTALARERVNALNAFTKELTSARGPPRVDRDPGEGRLPMETRKSGGTAGAYQGNPAVPERQPPSRTARRVRVYVGCGRSSSDQRRFVTS